MQSAGMWQITHYAVTSEMALLSWRLGLLRRPLSLSLDLIISYAKPSSHVCLSLGLFSLLCPQMCSPDTDSELVSPALLLSAGLELPAFASAVSSAPHAAPTSGHLLNAPHLSGPAFFLKLFLHPSVTPHGPSTSSVPVALCSPPLSIQSLAHWSFFTSRW